MSADGEIRGFGRRTTRRLAALGAALAALIAATGASAAPADPFAGNWLQDDGGVVSLAQSGSQISGTGPCPGATSPPGSTGVTYAATVGADGVSASFSYSSTVCTGTGGTFTATLAPDGVKLNASGVTQFGTGFAFSWTYQSGGTEPRALPAALCPTPQSPWTGRWLVTSNADPNRSSYVFVQTGSRAASYLEAGSLFLPGPPFTVAPRAGVISHIEARGADGAVTQRFDLVDPRRFEGSASAASPDRKDVGTLQGCGQVRPAPDLSRTIPSPQVVTAGPTGATVPGRISLSSLRRSKCIRVVVRTKKPARVLATIFSGRRSIRLFGQKEVLFRSAPARRVVCIRVPLRAHTFDVRTPLRFALGYRLGTKPRRRGERLPTPAIKRIRLIP